MAPVLQPPVRKSDAQLSSERGYVAAAMQEHGGSFVACLGRALERADSANTRKIAETWPEYWTQYLWLGIHDRQQATVQP